MSEPMIRQQSPPAMNIRLGALDPKTGKALAWNPTRTLGHGVETLVAHPKGLLVGSDTDQLGHEYHGRLGMFPAG
ncbi:hypothetical protein AB0C69_41700 [Actinomadura sp. NPDC048032]|uniref:hypothetical protein n=1 Tax=Actinomadura sp. NPDC048032 TaxID=3155747 RepID=UPI0033F9A7A4